MCELELHRKQPFNTL